MLVFSIILSLLVIALLFPTGLRYLISRSIDYFNFKVLAIFGYDTDPIIQKIAVQIPFIKISYLNKRVHFKINQLKLYLDLKENNLSQIDGNKNTKIDKSKILKNLESIIRQIIEDFKVIDRQASQKAQKKQSQYQKSMSGIFNFIIMVLLQVVELEVEKFSITIIENKGQQSLGEFKQEKTPSEITQMFKLFCTHRRYKLILPKFQLSTKVNKDENLEFNFSAKHFYADFKNNFTKKLDRCVKIEGLSVSFHMPFSFTSDDCINRSKIFISSESANCEFSPATCAAFKYLKYFRAYQTRLSMFKNNLIVKDDTKRNPMPKLIEINIPNVSLRFFKLEYEISYQEGFLHGQKCSEVNLKLTNVCMKVINKLHNYTIMKETISYEFNDLTINALIPLNDPISICHFQKGILINCIDYEIKTLKVLKTIDKFDQQKSELNIHPVCYQLYEAFINVNQRPYLEFDFELYNICLQKYISECQKKYVQDSKLSFTNNVNAANTQIYNQNQTFSSPSSGPISVMSGNNSNNNANSNNNLNINTGFQLQKELKLSDYLVIDDKILIETMLNTENIFENASIPYKEKEFKTEFIEMYQYSGQSKVSLKSVKPRYYCLQKEENSEYEGTYQYTFHNSILEKFIFSKNVYKQTEKVVTMEQFQQDITVNQDITSCNYIKISYNYKTANMKFQLLAVQIKENTFKDVLDNKNNFNTDYLDSVWQRQFVNPYQPLDPFSKPQKAVFMLLIKKYLSKFELKSSLLQEFSLYKINYSDYFKLNTQQQ